jgi:hypothetical protein
MPGLALFTRSMMAAYKKTARSKLPDLAKIHTWSTTKTHIREVGKNIRHSFTETEPIIAPIYNHTRPKHYQFKKIWIKHRKYLANSDSIEANGGKIG